MVELVGDGDRAPDVLDAIGEVADVYIIAAAAGDVGTVRHRKDEGDEVLDVETAGRRGNVDVVRVASGGQVNAVVESARPDDGERVGAEAAKYADMNHAAGRRRRRRPGDGRPGAQPDQL